MAKSTTVTWINCLNQECLHRAKVDLAALGKRYGTELPLAEPGEERRVPRLSIMAVENAPGSSRNRETNRRGPPHWSLQMGAIPPSEAQSVFKVV
jgi:hypothetical protein